MPCISWCQYSEVIPDDTDPDSRIGTWSVNLATFSDWFDNQILGITRGVTPTVPAAMYVAFHSTVCSKATPGTELSGNNYSRTLIAFTRVSDIKEWNATQFSGPATSAEITWRSVSLWDSATIGAGNYYAFANLAADTTLPINQAIIVPAQKFIVGAGSVG